jgi:hypothetical protein
MVKVKSMREDDGGILLEGPQRGEESFVLRGRRFRRRTSIDFIHFMFFESAGREIYGAA